MNYNQLGQSDLRASEICLGTMTWGEQNSEREAFEQLDYAADQGINILDTAELYAIPPRRETQGLTETIIGNWFKARNNRSEWIISTKVTGPSSRMDWFRQDGSLPRLDEKNIREAIEGSLKRLGTDYIDLYQLHWPDRPMELFGGLDYTHLDDNGSVPPEDSLRVLADLVAEGKVRHVGLSNETPWGLMKFISLADAMGLPRMSTVQNAYNLLNRTDEMGLSEVFYREGVSSLPYSPLGQGTLTGKYIDDACPAGSRKALFDRMPRYETSGANARVKEYKSLAESHGLTLTQLALAFCRSRPFIGATIIGATTMAQLKENIDAFDTTLSEDVLKGIEEIHLRQPNPCP